MENNQINYNRNFIKQVLFRIDFLEFIKSESITCAEVVKSIRAAFPVTTMQQIVKFNNISVFDNTSLDTPPNAFFNAREGIQQEYFTHDKKNRLVLSNSHFLTEFSEYSTFEEMCSSFENVLKVLLKETKFTASRTGLRFVNIFNFEEFAVKKTHFVSSVASALDSPKLKCGSGTSPIRSMSLNEYRKENININFRYGLFNKNYPNPQKGADFVLDYDCFTVDPLQGFNDIMKILDEAHLNIQELFENSISDNLRKVLRNE